MHILLFSLLLAAQDLPRESSYTLSEGATATLGKDAMLTLDAVRDSRCPPGKQCVRKGEIDFHFVLRKGSDSEEFTLNEDTPSYQAILVPATLSLQTHAELEKAPHNVTLQVQSRE